MPTAHEGTAAACLPSIASALPPRFILKLRSIAHSCALEPYETVAAHHYF